MMIWPRLSHLTYVLLLALLVLAACNLQQGDPTPTTSSTQQPQQDDDTQPTPSQPSLATLRPTPTSLPLVTQATSAQPGIPTAVPLGSTPGNALTPTLNPAEADQRYELQARAGQTVGVNYVVTITSGTIHFTMQGPDGVVWQKTLTTSETSRAEVPVTQGGTYEILVQIERFDGNYSVSWD